MLKITVEDCKGTYEFEGTDYDLAMESGVIMYHLVKNLRKSEYSDAFIRGLFGVAMEHDNFQMKKHYE